MDDATTTLITGDPDPAVPQAGSGRSTPLVTVAVVAHNPGAWFDEVLDSLISQDYPALDIMIVDAASDEPIADRVHTKIPEATVVPLVANQGFAKNANTVLDHPSIGAYVLLCHDDVALAPDCVSQLIEEALRSNAGIVGPKLLDWSDPARILHVGFGADKTGLVSDLAEPGEYDQEQHDAVRDVFAVPGAATLVRTDLFGALGGFDPEMVMRGEDLDLCWRAHALGARVLVNPAATARHREDLTTRIAGRDYDQYARRHRIRSLLSNYGPVHTLRVVPQAIAASLVNAVIALVQGRLGAIADIIAAWTWNLARLGSVISRRRHLARIRQVSDSEVRALQIPGFEGINAWRQARSDSREAERAGGDGRAGTTIAERSRELQLVAAVWVGIIAVLLLGSRQLILDGLPVFGEFGKFPQGPGPLLSEWASTWRRAGTGSEAPGSLLHLLLGSAGVAAYGQMGLVRLVATAGLILVGVVGVHRFMAPFGSQQGSLIAALVYSGAPVPYNALFHGSWGALAAYGALPWIARRMAIAAVIPPFGDRDVGGARRLADTAFLALTVAIAMLVEPLMVVAPVLLASTWTLAGLATRRVIGMLGTVIVAVVGTAIAVLLSVGSWPTLFSFGDWSSWLHAGQSSEDLGLDRVLRMATGPHGQSLLGWALLVVPAVALVMASGQRLAWAARGWFLALAAVAAVVVREQGLVSQIPGEPVLLLTPAALGLSIAAGMTAVAFRRDLVRHGFGWRQLVPLVAVAALLLTATAGVSGALDGRWQLVEGGHGEIWSSFDESYPVHARAMWVGDDSVLPVSSWGDADGHRFAITHARTPSILDHPLGPVDDPAVQAYDRLIASISSGSNRLGARLAPFGIRYIIVAEANAPEPFGTVTSAADPALLTRLAEQLDLVRVPTRPGVTVYQNQAWVPIVATFEVGTLAGLEPDTLTGAYLPALTERTTLRSYQGDTAPADLYAALGADTGWSLQVDGQAVPADSFGWASRYPVATSGNARLGYTNATGPMLTTIAQAIGWAVLIALLVLTRRHGS